ncbi:HPr family phosphocarrier protein [Saccharomonospora viridis]|jgi:phosphocarrier protein HPr|uniref:Phosphocarrier protein HPr n=2 Tax=Saccharomonospora viridis TaxID=1852 RepID=C7MSH4_SACVD|nr:HPr family phosphocarrier protein [Saccharomonospora viridis]ACU96572.1 phosphotransferase system HPr (HPr) family protein [Saccharomonospora viridis DSM 43017]KHF42716.1 phosphotransferase [Saccharomonospora viridis]SFO93274.1 phosphocarrier protein [Saccharomonospora viridis]
MAERTVTVASKIGLHARPAALVAKTAAAQSVPVTIAKDGGTPVQAASVLNLMTLGAKHGDTVVIAAEGEGAQEAVDAVADLIAQDLDG